MTGYDDADRIGAVGRADGAHGGRPAHPPRQFGIRRRGARRNAPQRPPDRVLKIGSRHPHRQRVDRIDRAAEIGAHRLAQSPRIARGDQSDRRRPMIDVKQALQAGLVVGPVDAAQIPVRIGDDDQFAGRRGDAVEQKRVRPRLRHPRRLLVVVGILLFAHHHADRHAGQIEALAQAVDEIARIGFGKRVGALAEEGEGGRTRFTWVP